MDNAIELLRDIFPDVPEKVIEEFYEKAVVKIYPKRERLCKQDEWADTLYILLRGEVGVVSEIGDGEFYLIDKIRYGTFGEISLIINTVRTATIYTREESTVMEVKKQDFRNFTKDHPEMAIAIARIVLKRLMEQDKKKLAELRQHGSLTGTVTKAVTYDQTQLMNELLPNWPIKQVANWVFKTISAFGEPSFEERFYADIFMIMPFKDELKPVYEHIKLVGSNLGYNLKRADDFFSHHTIMSQIWSVTNNAKLIICDCTGKNPNVFYELGIVHTLGKPTILITQDEADIPFDLRQFRYIEYENTSKGMIKLRADLEEHIPKMITS